MISRPARTLTGAVLAATLTAAVLSGCSDVRKLMNQGGDTPCSDYVKQDLDTKRVTITKFVKQKQDDDAHEPAGTIVDATMAAVDFLCSNQRNSATTIKNADLGGIVFDRPS